MIKSIRDNNDASIIPIMLFLITIFVVGALYTLFFIEVAFPNLKWMIPDSDSKVFIMMMMYALPLFVMIVGGIALIKEGLKRDFIDVGGQGP